MLQPPAAPEELARLAEEAGSTLPKAYLDFLRATNGAEGGPNDAPGDSLRLCAAGEVMGFNRGYRVQTHLPELLCLASDGGDYAFAFLRQGEADRWPVVRVPRWALCSTPRFNLLRRASRSGRPEVFATIAPRRCAGGTEKVKGEA